MSHPGSLVGRGLGGAHVHAAVHRERIDGDDLD